MYIISMVNFLEFFNKYVFYLLGLLFIFDILILFWVSGLRKQYKKVFQASTKGGGVWDMEKVLIELQRNQIAFESALKEIVKKVGDIEGELPKDIRRIGLVRYNPFSGTGAGGDQSFALALLNEKNDGVVISSLYGREMNRVYAKLIKEGKSNYQLTGEESQAISDAK